MDRCQRWRAVGLIVFFAIAAAAAVPLLLLRLPSEHDGLRRLDRRSGETHRPATAIADEMAANQNDPVTQALWRAHVERALMSAAKLKAGWPQPKLSLRDPMALRALTLILVVASFFAAGGERVKRITAAFDWQGVVAPANFRIDAWSAAGLYRRPVMLPGLRPAKPRSTAPVSVPTGSQLVIAPPAKCASISSLKAASSSRGRQRAPAAPKNTACSSDRRPAAVHGIGGAISPGISSPLPTGRRPSS